MDTCPCGFGEPYERCCGRYHRGAAAPPTATILMRARYTAFAVGDEGFLRDTGPGGGSSDGRLIDPDRSWTGLFITGSTAGGLLDDQGTVEFIARFSDAVGRGAIRENSRFRRLAGRWRYRGPA